MARPAPLSQGAGSGFSLRSARKNCCNSRSRRLIWGQQRRSRRAASARTRVAPAAAAAWAGSGPKRRCTAAAAAQSRGTLAAKGGEVPLCQSSCRNGSVRNPLEVSNRRGIGSPAHVRSSSVEEPCTRARSGSSGASKAGCPVPRKSTGKDALAPHKRRPWRRSIRTVVVPPQVETSSTRKGIPKDASRRKAARKRRASTTNNPAYLGSGVHLSLPSRWFWKPTAHFRHSPESAGSWPFGQWIVTLPMGTKKSWSSLQLEPLLRSKPSLGRHQHNKYSPARVLSKSRAKLKMRPLLAATSALWPGWPHLCASRTLSASLESLALFAMVKLLPERVTIL
mmetsp:Transcript_37145/g.115568  ORF Transcript_37145/g.115568 Transcript_37145/m.115568 type:complete len:338 (+) Transcript_37145:514-1527(+)